MNVPESICRVFHASSTNVIVLLGIAVFSSRCVAEGRRNPSSPNGGVISAGLRWSEVDPSAKLTVLQMLLDHTKGNYEKIRTWEGSYTVRLGEYITRDQVAEVFGDQLGREGVVPLMKYSRQAVRFAIEIRSDSIYRSVETSERRFVNAESNEAVDIREQGPKGVHSEDMRSVVTPEHYLRFYPHDTWPGFGFLPDHPEARNRRAAFRDSAEKSVGHQSSDLMDPRDFFSFGDHRQTFAKELSLFTRPIRDESGEDQKSKAHEMLSVYQAADPEGEWYRIIQKLTGPDGSSTIYSTTIWSPAVGFNPVSHVLRMNRSDGQPLQARQWRWKLVEGVYMPAWVKETRHAEGTGQLGYEREVELDECVVNRSLDPKQFTYEGLGLADGELVVDRTEEVVYTMKHGTPEKLADFGEKYVSPDQTSPSTRWLWVALSSLCLVVALVLLWSRRARAHGM